MRIESEIDSDLKEKSRQKKRWTDKQATKNWNCQSRVQTVKLKKEK